MGTYNTIKATIEHVRASKGAYIHVSATLHYNGQYLFSYHPSSPISLHRKKLTISDLDPSCSIGTPYQVHVSAAKAGVDALSAVLAVEEGPHGVRSNVIAPGPIAGTEGMDRLTPKNTGADHVYHGHPTGRQGDVKDIANATIFLFSPAASYITGQVLPVDGGSEHLRSQFFPYPQSVLDPQSVAQFIKAKM
jgi:peroxisomal 2,4-dienoyl-CoA reductase